MSKARAKLLVVGAGPTGLTLAILLRLRGFDPVVVDRQEGPTTFPAAHVVNTRSQEVFAEIDVARRIHDAGDPTALYSNVVWAESLTGEQFGILRIPVPAQGETGPFSPFVAVNIPQTRTETILRERFAELGGEVTYGSEVVAVVPGDEASAATAHLVTNGVEGRQEFDLILGCDGAASSVRRSLGIMMEGPRTIARFMTIYFEADLDPLIASRPALLYWIGGTAVRGVFVCFDNPARTWALLVPIGDLPIETFDTADALAMVRKAIGKHDADITLSGVSSWNMSAQVADRYRQGRVILAGDACHRFPPTGGLGMNTGIQDAHNLAWKIDVVLEGQAPFHFLDTYEEERRPVAVRNTEQSVRNLHRMSMIDEALGVATLAPVTAAAAAGPYVPHPPHQLGLAGDTPDALRKQQDVQQAIDQQGEHFGQGAGLDLGFVYRSETIVPDGSPPASSAVDDFRPDARPGARLPFLSPDGCYETSTLASIAKAGITLFVADPSWVEVAQEASRLTGISIAVVSVGKWSGSPTAQATLGIGSNGAVGVRPDGHVFWRTTQGPSNGRSLGHLVTRAYGRAMATSPGERGSSALVTSRE